MSATPPPTPPPSGTLTAAAMPHRAPPMTPRRLLVATRVLARLAITRGRVVAFVAGSVPLLIAAVAIGLEDGRVTRFVEEAALGLALPIGTLTIATAVLGDLADDATLVYLRLRPIGIVWQATAATLAATIAAGPPLAALSAVIAIVGGQPGLALAAAASAMLGTLAYSGVFVALGLRTNRSLLWGLLYVLVVEGFLSRLSSTMSTYAIRRYVGSLYEGWGGRAALDEVSVVAALVTLVAITAAGVALTTRWLVRRDVP